MECAVCGISGERVRLFDAISGEGIIKLCKNCASEENFPLLKRTGFIPEKPEEAENYVRKMYLSDLLDRYFDRKDISRLPAEYKPFIDIYRKIRNSLVHPEEFTFTEPMVRQTLTSISELIKSLEGKKSSRN